LSAKREPPLTLRSGTLSVLRTLADKDVRDPIHTTLAVSVPTAIFAGGLFCYARPNQTEFSSSKAEQTIFQKSVNRCRSPMIS
jgi:hypothetical protein